MEIRFTPAPEPSVYLEDLGEGKVFAVRGGAYHGKTFMVLGGLPPGGPVRLGVLRLERGQPMAFYSLPRSAEVTRLGHVRVS